MFMMRIVSGVFLVVLMLSTATAQDFEQRFISASGATAVDPAATRALSDFVDIMTRAGYFDLALAAIEQHLERHPHDAGADLIAARTLVTMGAREQAESHVRRAMQSGALDDVEMRRAALLLAGIDASQNPAPAAATVAQQHDSLATAALPKPENSRDRIGDGHAEYRLDEGVLRRIYGEPAKPAAGAKIADLLTSRQPGIVQANALAGSGDTYWSHLLGNESERGEANAAPNLAGAHPDMSLRYTFALY